MKCDFVKVVSWFIGADMLYSCPDKLSLLGPELPKTKRTGVKTMDELIKQVTKKAGISEKQAQQAVETTLEFLKEKLPAPIASQVEGVLGGGKAPDLGDVGKKLGELLG